MSRDTSMRTPLVRAGIVAGLGLGGFVDGIVLHQILQWHHMICWDDLCPPTSLAILQRQNMYDGFFHLGTLILTIIGFFMLFNAARRPDVVWSRSVLTGALLAGWGIFNFVEGLIDHQILGIHHVRLDEHQFLADMLFLASGLLLAAIGWMMIRAGASRALTAPRHA